MTCAACGAAGLLEPWFQVAGAAGSEGLVPTTDRYGVALGDFVRCASCGHLQLSEMPAELAYEDAASSAYELEEAGQRATASGVMDRIERYAPARRGGRFLDYGAWVGFLGSEAAARGWEVVGVEPSRWAAERARGRGVPVVAEADLAEAAGLPAGGSPAGGSPARGSPAGGSPARGSPAGGSAAGGSPPGGFAAIALGDVIEHLPDPGATLDRLAGLLGPDGVIWIATPDAGSRVARGLGRRWWSVIPTHVHLFTRWSMRALLERHGFELLAMRTSPKTFSVAYYLDRASGYSPALGRALVGAARAAGIADRLWTPDFRDRFEVVARFDQAEGQSLTSG